MTQENYWWFSVRYRSDDPMQVERFETEEQAELHAAITGGCAIGPYDRDDLNSRHILMRLSERNK